MAFLVLVLTALATVSALSSLSSRRVRQHVRRFAAAAVSLCWRCCARGSFELDRLLRATAETRRPRVLSARARLRARRDAAPAPPSAALAALDAANTQVFNLLAVFADAPTRDAAPDELASAARELEATAAAEATALATALARVERECEDELVDLYLEVTCLEEECKQKMRSAVAQEHATAERRLRAAALKALEVLRRSPDACVNPRTLPSLEEAAVGATSQSKGGLPTVVESWDEQQPPPTPPSPSVAAAAAAAAAATTHQQHAAPPPAGLLLRASEMLRVRRGLGSGAASPRSLLFRPSAGSAPLSPTTSLGAADATSDDEDSDDGTGEQ
jgi:hypothetical protein